MRSSVTLDAIHLKTFHTESKWQIKNKKIVLHGKKIKGFIHWRQNKQLRLFFKSMPANS